MQPFTVGNVIYIHKVVISVCQFVCMSDLPKSFDLGTRENHGNVLSWVGPGKIEKIEKKGKKGGEISNIVV